MRKLLICILIFYSIASTYAQNGVTFNVEKLSKPERLLPTESDEILYRKMILSEAGLEPRSATINNKYPYNIIAKNEAPDNLVNAGNSAFFKGMHLAYAEHRPFILSPDMIWLLISQGFAQHINANKEEMRSYFVDYSGKQSLIAQSKKSLNDSTLVWEEIFSQFTEQIKKNVKGNLIELLTCNFSTTTLLEKTASEITIMEAMKPYFEFIVMYLVCGIPEITLEGTPEDWEKVLAKARELKEYKLEWWISELEPVLEEFVKASKGKVNKEFWRNMFKSHSKGCGDPEIIDGWIVKFFPYNKYGIKNDLKQIKGGDSLPNEFVKVDVKFLEVYDNLTEETELEVWSGFIGLKQNKDNFALRPQMGWMVRKKENQNTELARKLNINAQDTSFTPGSGICLRVKEFPPVVLSELLRISENRIEKFTVNRLELQFVDDINIPDELSKVDIKELVLSGKISIAGKMRIKKLFPNTKLTINGDRW